MQDRLNKFRTRQSPLAGCAHMVVEALTPDGFNLSLSTSPQHRVVFGLNLSLKDAKIVEDKTLRSNVYKIND